MFTLRQACTYLPTGMPCIIQAVFPDRHRARILLENSHELDEVAWHDLAVHVAPIPPTVVKPEPVTIPEDPTDSTPADEDAASPISPVSEGRRWRTRPQGGDE